jgi:hypothetical protein
MPVIQREFLVVSRGWFRKAGIAVVLGGAVVAGPLMVALPTRAEPNAPQRPSQLPAAEPTRGATELVYAGFVAGLNVSNIRAALQLNPQGYEMGVSFRTAGLVGTFLKAENISRAQGVWRGGRAAPKIYASAGLWRGNPREIEIEYSAGQPVIKRFNPPVDPEHEPVPEALRQNTTDSLSAIANLVHLVASTGGCDGETTTFDGRRLSKIVVHTVGMETLPPESRSSFSGPALRCDIDGRQIAGFPLDAGPDDMIRKPQHSTVWLATVTPGMPAVPVMMSLEVRLLGHMTIYLTQARPGAQLAQFTPRLSQ